MAGEAEKEFVRQAWLLAKSNPSVWRTFVEAFNRLTISVLENGLSAPTSDSAMMALGFGRQMVQLRNDFADIENKARKLGVV